MKILLFGASGAMTYKSMLGILCLFFLVASSAAQPSISISVRNAPANCRVYVSRYAEPITYRTDTLASAVLDNTGKATLRFNVEEPARAELHVAQQVADLYLEKETQLEIDVDYVQFDSTITFKGPIAPNQRYLLREIIADFRGAQLQYSLFDDATVYKKYLDSVQNAHRMFYRNSDTNAMSAPFREYARKTIEYQYYSSLDMFGVTFDLETGEITEGDQPEGYYDDLRALDIADDESANNSSYIAALDMYSLHFVTKVNNVRESYYAIKGAFTGKVRDLQLATLLSRHGSALAAQPSMGDSLMSDFAAVCTTPLYARIVDSLYRVEKSISSGKVCPDLEATDANGNTHKLSEFKGKVVYIDMWATWCAPCVAGLKESPNLRSKFDTTQIAFVYINVHDDVDRWKRYFKSYNLGAHSWNANKDQNTAIQRALSVSAIPRYVLIDRQGKFIESRTVGPDRIEEKLREAVAKR